MADDLGAVLGNHAYRLFIGTSFSNFILETELRLTDKQVVFDPALNVDEEMLEVIIYFAKTLYYVVSVSDQLFTTTV